MNSERRITLSFGVRGSSEGSSVESKDGASLDSADEGSSKLDMPFFWRGLGSMMEEACFLVYEQGFSFVPS